MTIFQANPVFYLSKGSEGGTEFERFAVHSSSSSSYPIINFNFNLYKTGGCGQASILADRDLGLTYTDLVEINLSGELMYAGYIVTPPKIGTDKNYIYSINGYVEKLKNDTIEKVTFNNIKLEAAIKLLLSDYIVSYSGIKSTTSQIDIGSNIGGWDTELIGMDFLWKTPHAILTVLSDLAGNDFKWGVDAERRLFFKRKEGTGYGEDPITNRWWVGKGDLIRFTPVEAVNNIKNKLFVDCGTMSDGQNYISKITDEDSIGKYGLHAAQISLPDAYPKYNSEDILYYPGWDGIWTGKKGARALGFNGVDTGITHLLDNNDWSCWNSNTDQIGGVEYWTKAESGAGIISPTLAGQGMGEENSASLQLPFVGAPGYPFANNPNSKGLLLTAWQSWWLDTTVVDANYDRGAVSFWVIPQYNYNNPLLYRTDAGATGVPGYDRAMVLFEMASATKGQRIGVGYGIPTGETFGVFFLINGENSGLITTSIIESSFAFNFLANQRIHVGLTWDSSDEDNNLVAQTGLSSSTKRALWIYWEDENGNQINPSAAPPKNAMLSSNQGMEDFDSIWADTITIGQDNANNSPAVNVVIDNLKYYNYVYTDFKPLSIKQEELGSAYQIIEVGLDSAQNVGKIIIDMENPSDKDSYSKGIKVEVLRESTISGPSDLGFWDTIYLQEDNSTATLELLLTPTPKISQIRITNLGNTYTSPDDLKNNVSHYWHIYGIRAYTFNMDLINQWSLEQLDDNAEPTPSATAEIDGSGGLLLPEGMVKITDKDGIEYEYELNSINYTSESSKITLQLGAEPDDISYILKQKDRKLIMDEYNTVADNHNTFTGDGMVQGSIGDYQISNISANKIITGSITSTKYYDDVGGMKLDLDAAKIYVLQEDGLEIVSGGGIHIGYNGSLRGGQTAYNSGRGFYFGYSVSLNKYVLSIGNSDGNNLTYDGLDLTLTGAIVATSGFIGGFVIGTHTLTTGGAGMGDDTQGYAFWAGSDTPASAEFRVTHAGAITAESGFIGGLTIVAEAIYGTDAGMTSEGSGAGAIRFWAGDTYANRSTADFRVTEGGAITALSGHVATWVISGTTLSSANITLDSGNDRIVVNTITIDGANDRIRSSNYVSGTMGDGFTLGPDLLEVGNIACRGIFRTSVFQTDTISVVGGSVLVRPGDVLATDMTALDSSALTIEGNETFSVGDILRMKNGTDDEWLEVTNIGSAPTYAVTRDKASSYGADSNPAWTGGQSVVNYGQSGDGGVYLTSSETNAPYISIFNHAGSPWTSITTYIRIGNLNGFLGETNDYYGIAIGEATKYLKYDSTNGLRIAGSVSISGTISSSDWDATNGVRLDLNNRWLKMGGSNVTAVGGAAGVFLGLDSTYKFYIGDGSNSYIKYDSANGVVISVDSIGGLTVKSGGDIIIEGGGKIKFDGAYSDWFIETVTDGINTQLLIYPDTTPASEIIIGAKNWSFADDVNVVVLVGYSKVEFVSYDSVGASWNKILFDGGTKFYPSTGGVDLGQIGDKWKDLVMSGTAYIAGKVEVGGGYGSSGLDLNANGSLDMDGDLQCDGTIYTDWNVFINNTSGAVYIGATLTDGTWRMIRSGNDLLFQRRESGVYVTKSTISA